MDPATIAAIIQGGISGIKALRDLYSEYEAERVVLSATDLAQIKAALADAQAMTADLAPKVDAVLDAAAKR